MKGGIGPLDFWRLSDELSIVDAASLTIGLDPGEIELVSPLDPSRSKILRVSGFSEDEDRALRNGDLDQIQVPPHEFRAVFKALRHAVLDDRLQVKTAKRARTRQQYRDAEGRYLGLEASEDETTVYYGYLLKSGRASVFSNASSLHKGTAEEGDVLYALIEPDWADTTIAVVDLKEWFKERGVFPSFFFPEGAREGFRELSNPRYSAKLAAAVAAWEAVTKPASNKSVKQSLSDWIRSNGLNFGLGGTERVVSQSVADEVAKIANWDTAGGATPTATSEGLEGENLREPVPNFEKYEDGEIPF